MRGKSVVVGGDVENVVRGSSSPTECAQPQWIRPKHHVNFGLPNKVKKKGGPSNTIESLVDTEKLIIWKKYMEIINIH